MRSIARPLLLLSLWLVTSCGHKAYDWSATKAQMKLALPEGTGVDRAGAVLDSLGFTRGPFDERARTITARRREPDMNRMVFSTLRVILVFDEGRRLLRCEMKEVFTGP